jgi:Protein of unknown function (DUF3352)
LPDLGFAMKLRSFFSVLGAVVLVLLLLGAGGYYWLVTQSPLNLLKGGRVDSPSAAMFVPKQAPAMASLLVHPDRLDAFRQVVAQPQNRRRTRAELTQLKQSFLANTGLDYAQDIQPWLGDELTLAVTTLDVDRDASNGRQPGYLLAIATQDPERSREFLQLLWQKRAIAGTDLVFEQYKGVKLIYSGEAEQKVAVQRQAAQANPTDPQAILASLSLGIPTLASAVVGDRFVLFANYPKVLRDAITNAQAPDLNLGHARFYQDSIAALTEPRIGLSFVNLPGLANWLEQESTTAGPSAQTNLAPGKAGKNTPSDQATAAKPTYKTLAIALGLNRQGLAAETALMATDGDGKTITSNLIQPVAALDYIPATSPFSASGTDLQRLWADLPPRPNRDDVAAVLLRPALQNLQTRWQLDLPQDIFSWVTEDYALGVLPLQATPTAPNRAKSNDQPSQAQAPQNQIVSPKIATDWVFVAQRSAQADAAIAHLDDLARAQGLTVGPLALGEQTVSAWTRLKSTTIQPTTAIVNLQADIQGVHATRGNYEIFTTSLTAMDQALAGLNRSQGADPRFARATQPLGKPNNGYLYIDWPASQPLLEQQFPALKLIELAGQPLFQHLRSLALSSYGSQNGIQHAGLFIRLSGS